MVKAGVLVHVYHLEAAGWEGLVWGDPALGLMGTLPKLVQIILTQDVHEPIEKIIMYTGPSHKDGLDENSYAIKFLCDHFDQLVLFPQLKPLIEKLSDEQLQGLRRMINDIVQGPELVNSFSEVTTVATFFQEHGITKVYQIAVASHAPRCLQLQAMARYNHQIPAEQLWYSVAADTTFMGTTPADVVVVEPPHRGDDPALGVHPSITDVLKQYYKLDNEHREPFIAGVASLLESLSSNE
jgi:hypothetical protein